MRFHKGAERKIFLKGSLLKTPRAAAKEQLLVSKTRMQAKLRGSNSELKEHLGDYVAGINRVSSLGQATCTMLTDGTDFGLLKIRSSSSNRRRQFVNVPSHMFSSVNKNVQCIEQIKQCSEKLSMGVNVCR